MEERELQDTPPEAPSLRRRVTFGKGQIAGIVFLASVPLAALAGVFGESFAEVSAGSAELEVRMRYPERYRYKQVTSIEITLRNVSGRTLDTVTVVFEPEYVLRFSNARFTPSASRAFEVPLEDVEPGRSRLVVASLQAERYGTHRGVLRVTAGGADTLRLPLDTTVFP